MLTTRERSRMEGIRQMGLVVECAVRVVILVVPHSGSWEVGCRYTTLQWLNADKLASTA